MPSFAFVRFGMAWLAMIAAIAGAEGPDAEGEGLYHRWCSRCHGVSARGDGADASLFPEPPPPLRGTLVLARYSDVELSAWIREGRRLELGLRPEILRRQSRRTEALYAHIKRLPLVDWRAVERGRDLYDARCLTCHGDYGHDPQPGRLPVSRLPDLSAPERQASLDDEELRLRVRHSAPGQPALASPITDPQARQITAFVRLLSPGYELYDRFCLGCHGFRGEGAPRSPRNTSLPQFSFDAAYFARRSPDWTLERVWHMLRDSKGEMPHFAASLDEAQVREILTYLRSLPPEGETLP